MHVSPEARLIERGITRAEPPRLPFTPRCKPVVVYGGIAYLSGNGDLCRPGRGGDTITPEGAVLAARTTAHLMCRALRDELGSLDRVERWGEERGICARSAIGVAELRSGLAVEVEAHVALAG
ncbi:MAG: hypothetical protein WCH31_05295 [Actinomycetes bacterium]